MANKPVLILLPGALGAQSMANDLSSELQEDFELVRLDYPGHGSEVYNGALSIEIISQKMAEKIRMYRYPFVFGYSMGGYVAIYTQLTRMANFRGIITYGTKFDWNPEVAKRESSRLDPAKIQEKVPQYAKHLSDSHESWQKLCQQTGQLMLELGKKPLLNQDHEDYISTPLLVLRGSNDKMVSEDESIWASKISSDGKFESCDGWEHPLEKLDKRELADKIRNFTSSILN